MEQPNKDRIRKIDELGRIGLPLKLREAKGWKYETLIEFEDTADGLHLREYKLICVCCGTIDLAGGVDVAGKHLCKACADLVKAN